MSWFVFCRWVLDLLVVGVLVVVLVSWWVLYVYRMMSKRKYDSGKKGKGKRGSTSEKKNGKWSSKNNAGTSKFHVSDAGAANQDNDGNWSDASNSAGTHSSSDETDDHMIQKPRRKKSKLKAIQMVDIEWKKDEATGRFTFKEIEGSVRDIPCELALLAIGYIHPQHEGMLKQLNIALTNRGNAAFG